MADDKCIFLIGNIGISIEISPKFVPRGQINNIPALFQTMPWHWPGDKPLSLSTIDGIGYRHVYASLGLNELNNIFDTVCIVYVTFADIQYGVVRVSIVTAKIVLNSTRLLTPYGVGKQWLR